VRNRSRSTNHSSSPPSPASGAPRIENHFGSPDVFTFVTADARLDDFCSAEWARLVGALSLYTGDRELAEELAQESLVRLVRHWRHVRSLDAPSAWLHRVAMNLAKSHFRRLRVARRIARTTDNRRPPEPDPAEALVIRAAVAQLPERERAAVVLRFYVGLPVRDTAAALGCPEGTVKTLTHRAIGMLRAAGIVDEEVLDAH
jgi:RNA polymerase sigma-70 factor (ECF subfamily)